jgi:hypothetical protein
LLARLEYDHACAAFHIHRQLCKMS